MKGQDMEARCETAATLGADCIHPVLFRAMFQSQIGDNCPFPTIKAAADHYGVHPEQFRLFVRGERPAEPRLLDKLGFERVTFYRPKSPKHQPKDQE